MPVAPLSIPDFAKSIKDKYPQYKDVPDTDLVNKIVEKYPQYKDKVKMDQAAPAAAPTTQAEPKNDLKSQMLNYQVPGTKNPPTSEKQPTGLLPEAPASIISDEEKDNTVLHDAMRSKPVTDVVNKMLQDDYAKSIEKPADQHSENQPIPKPDIKLTNEELKQQRESLDYMNPNSPAGRVLLEHAKANSNDPEFNKNINGALANKNPDLTPETKTKVRTGEYGYDLLQNRPTLKVGAAQNFIEGVEGTYMARQKADDLASKSKEEIIKDEEANRNKYDPNTPIIESNGWASTAANMVGSNAAGIEKGILGSMASIIPGMQGAGANTLGTLFLAHDAGKMAAGETFSNAYHELRNKGIASSDAYDQALDQSKSSGTIAALQMGAMGYAGIKLGKEPFGAGAVKKGFTEFLKNAAPEVGAQMSIAGLAKGIDNVNRGKPLSEDVATNMAGAGLLVGGIAALGAGAEKLSSSEKSAALNGYAKMNPEVVDATINQTLAQKSITPEKAEIVKTQIQEQRDLNKGLPDNVPDENKQKIQNRLQKIDELKKTIDSENPDALHSAFHADVKEKIKGIEEEIAELSKPIPEKEVSKSVSVIRPEDNKPPNVVEKPSVSVIRPEDNKHPQIIEPELNGLKEIQDQLKPQENAIPEQSASSVLQHPQEPVGETGGERGGMESGQQGNETTGTQSEESKVAGQEKVNPLETVENKGGETVGITHEKMNELSRELGLPEYEEAPETVEAWDKEADSRIAKDPEAISKLLNKMRNGNMPDHVEQRMILKYVSDLKARYNATESDEILNQIKRVKDLSNIVGGRMVGKSLRARQDEIPVEQTLPDYMIREMETSGVDHLTEGQKKQVKSDYENITGAEEDYKAKSQKLEAEVAKLKAEKEFAKTKGSKSATKPTGEKKDFAAERKSIIDEYKAKKAADTTKRQGAGITDEDVKLVAKLLKSYVEEGVENLKDAVGKIHEAVKDALPDISDKDIHNIIAGEYNVKKPTRNELAAKVKDLKDEAALVNRLEKLQNGEEPKTEKKKIERNRAITELQGKIKEFVAASKELTPEQKEELRDIKSLKTIKARNEAELKRVQAEIDKGNFEPDKKKPSILESEEAEKKYPQLYKEAREAKEKLVKLKQDREIRLIKQKYAQKNRYQKFGDYAAEVINTPRSIMSSFDFSAPFRQGIIPTVAHPDLAVKAMGAMFKNAFSQKSFDEWFHNLRESPEFKIMKDSDLYVADPHDFRLTAKEEAFMSNLAEKLPLGIGRVIAGSERAYVTYLNKMRVDLFNRGAEILSSEGHTFKNSEQDYKSLATWVNNSTGRGQLPDKLQNAAPLLNSAFFSPRLIASRVNLMTQWFNPRYYKNTPASIRVMAMKDMIKFIGFGLTVLGVAKAAGASVETDATSTDFGKIRDGNTRYDIWGGFQPFIRVAAQLIMGHTKSTNNGKYYDLNGKGAFGKTRSDVLGTFARGKLAPVPGMAMDFISGRKTTGEPVTVKNEIAEHFLPLLFTDIADAYKDRGVKSAIAPALASTFGVSVQTWQPPKKKNAVGVK